MQPMPPSIDLDALRANTDWMTRLARRLVGDADADDLVQDAWMVALRSEGDRAKSAGWLAGVVRNLARLRRRGELRRKRREERVARREAIGSTADVVERLAAQRQVTDAVLGLPEPVREAILLRYERGLTLSEIAVEQSISVTGVHRRIERGHHLLRERLERAHDGDRTAWALAILPLAEASGTGAALPMGALSMSVGMKLAATAAVAASALGVFWMSRADESKREVLAEPRQEVAQAPEPRSSGAVASPAILGGAAGATSERSPVTAPAQPASAAPADVEPETVASRTGNVVDLQGVPLPDVALVVVEGPDREVQQRVLSDAAGRFAIEPTGQWVQVEDENWVTIVPGALRESSELTVVAGPVATLSGWVVDEDGQPIEGVELRIETTESLYRRLSLLQLYPHPPEEWRDRSDAGGRFAFEAASVGDGIALVTKHPLYLHYSVDLADVPHDNLEVVLSARPLEDAVWGVVLDATGEPVPDAHVAWLSGSTRTDAQGHFEVERYDPGDMDFRGKSDGAVLRALKEGYLPATIPAGQEIVSPVELRLGGAPLSIEGRVVDAAGTPVPRAVIWLADPTSFGMYGVEGRHGETWIHATQESLLGSNGPWHHGAVADGEGRFELASLLDRDYQLLACSPHSFEGSPLTPVRAGATGVTLVLGDGARVERVSARFLSADGSPIAGMRVSARRNFAADTQDFGAPTYIAGLEDPVTDDEGRVVFERFAIDGGYLDFYLDGRYLPPPLQLAELDDPTDFEYMIPLPCRLQVDASALLEACDRVTVLDANGNELQMHIQGGSFSYLSNEADLIDGVTSVVEVDQRARTVVLWNGDQEVARRAIELSYGSLTRVGL